MTYAFLKMYFQQEKLPKQLSIGTVHILDVKTTASVYIATIDSLEKNGVDLKKSRYAHTNKYWLVKIYNQIQQNKLKK